MQIEILDLDFRDRTAQVVLRDHRGTRDVPLSEEFQATVLAACEGLSVPAPDSVRLVAPSRRVIISTDKNSRVIEGKEFESRALETFVSISHQILEWIRAQGPPREAPSDGHRSSEFWNGIYEAGAGGWDLGAPSPPLERLLATVPLPPEGGEAIVLGCGRGHDVRAAARLGWRATGIDFAAQAVADATELSAREGIDTRFVQADLFDLPAELGPVDVVLEHTCFCAIDPTSRDDYVAAVLQLLRPGGRLVGVFYHHGREGGPPFDTDPEELRRRFGTDFDIEHLETTPDSPLHRTGSELGAVFRRP